MLVRSCGVTTFRAMLSLFRHGLEWPWVVHVQIASHNLVMGRRLPATERTPVENGH